MIRNDIIEQLNNQAKDIGVDRTEFGCKRIIQDSLKVRDIRQMIKDFEDEDDFVINLDDFTDSKFDIEFHSYSIDKEDGQIVINFKVKNPQ